MSRNQTFIILIVLVVGGLSLLTVLREKPHEPLSDQVQAQHEHYTCPMHPEIRENKPGSCPICHMPLVKVEPKKSKESEAELTLDVSPYQASLIGLKPIVVQKKPVQYSLPVSGRVVSRQTVAIQVFESDLQYVDVGDRFSGRLAVDSNRLLQGKITFIDSFLDPTSRTVMVVGTFEASSSKNLVESTFSGQIRVDLGVKIFVPESAILFTGSGAYVYRYKDSKLTPQKVEVGLKFGENYVVESGIEEGARISSGPNFLIDSEAKIRGLNDKKHH